MDIVEIKGDWIGYYTYDKGYSQAQKQQMVPFRMCIERGINEFVGRIFEEDAYGGIDDDIVVRGHQNGDDLEFVKYYTLEHFTDENDTLVSMKSDNPTVVYYKGTYDHGAKKFSGTWEIPALREDDDGVFHDENFTGAWFLWRESD